MRTNEEIMDILDELKEKENLSISEIARRTNMAKSAVSRYFNRTREFPLNRVDDFAKALHVTSEYILGLDFEKPDNMIFIDEIVNVPVVGQIAAGAPILAEQHIEDYVPLAKSMIPSGDLIALDIKGNSMAPGIPNGAQVVVRLQPDVEEGEVAAVLVNGDTEATLKRIKRQNGVLILIPDNPEYQPIVVNNDVPARIIGKAVKVIYSM